MSTQTDVIIIGAGAAGLSAAGLSAAGLSIEAAAAFPANASRRNVANTTFAIFLVFILLFAF